MFFFKKKWKEENKFWLPNYMILTGFRNRTMTGKMMKTTAKFRELIKGKIFRILKLMMRPPVKGR